MILIPFFSIIILVFVNILLSYKGNKLYWFYEASHFAGGFILAALFINFWDRKSVLLAILMMGILWEVYELVINKNKKIKKYLEDRYKYYITPLDSFFSSCVELTNSLYYSIIHFKSQVLMTQYYNVKKHRFIFGFAGF